MKRVVDKKKNLPNKEVITDIQSHIQFAMTALIFFSGLLYLLTNKPGVNQVPIDDGNLLWGLGVASYIATYLLVRLIQRDVKEWWIKIIRGSISLGLASCAISISIMFTYWNTGISGWAINFFRISFEGTVVLPIVTFLLTLLAVMWFDLEGISFLWKHFKSRKKR